MFESGTVLAVNRESGDSWTYQMYTELEVGEFPLDMFGNVTYEFKAKDSLAMGLTETSVNIIGVEGELSGTAFVLGEPFVDAHAVMTGTQYETETGVGTVKEDMHWLVNTSIGSDALSWLTQTDIQTVVVYDPAFMSEFDPKSIDKDLEWSESIHINMTVYDWQNGTQTEVSNDRFIADFFFELDSTEDSITTPAGTFETVVITVTAENGDRDVLWWSEEVDNFVKTVSYYAGEEEAYESMTLSSFEEGSQGSTLLIIVAGVAFAVVATAVLVLVLIHKRPMKS